MSLPRWVEHPDRYERCARCAGRGGIDCPACNGSGSVVGPDRYLYARTIGRRFGLKVCTTCNGRGKLRCGICDAGSVRKS